ncbi:TetR/AcrR family transcriptional regulator [Microvirga calopogonii]|uniref:TetR/AcrR family transcriptional regulator n=1 Tax=Microvirga calopogonii TaxID=2078013 RepID=UPI000E0DE3CF|nr:TetR/AcrR family transcriptional regulator [Microvirga calopogonii]
MEMAVQKAVRRTQEERAAETRLRLLDATITLLLERGYSRTTTTDIAAAAGVSRGALTHHFASKEEIVTRAVQHQLRNVTADLHRLADELKGVSTDDVIDYLWDMMAGGLFLVTLEYLPEARHNPDFKAQMVPVVKEFHAALDTIWTRLSEYAGLDPARAKVMLNATMCLIRGMVAQTIVRDDPDYFQNLLAYWKDHLRETFILKECAAKQ